MRIVAANGIATHGKRNVDLLLRILKARGFEIVDARLPMRHWFAARWKGAIDGDILAQASSDGDIVVAHSFGCLRTWWAHQQRDYAAIVCIAPAMDPETGWAYPERVHCFHSNSDLAVRIGSLLLFHPFGAAGNHGFSQDGVTNNDYTGAGHSDYFKGSRLTAIANYVAQLAGGAPAPAPAA